MNINIYPLKLSGSIFLSLVFLTCSCQNGDDQKKENKDKQTIEKNVQETKETQERVEAAKKIFYTIPSPLETASLFKKAGADYRKDLLNPIDHVDAYATNKKKALNLGIYGADLSYSSIYERTQQTMHYLNCSKALADGLAINDAFGEDVIKRLETNLNNRDSLLTIVSDTYWRADAYLKENNRENISALIITGGWIEGLFIGSHSIDSIETNSKLARRIAEQKYSYEHLISLLGTFPDDPAVKSVRDQIIKLDDAYASIKVENKGKTTTSKNENTGVTTIEGGFEVKYTVEQIRTIKTIVAEIRKNFVTP